MLSLGHGIAFYSRRRQRHATVESYVCILTCCCSPDYRNLLLSTPDAKAHVHSLFFSAVLSVSVTAILAWHERLKISRSALFAYLFLATASHGILDAMTNRGLGVAFFSPFDNSRYFLPWRPIRVSPIAIHRFFSARGYAVLRSELLWVWIPAILFAGVVMALKRIRPTGAPATSN